MQMASQGGAMRNSVQATGAILAFTLGVALFGAVAPSGFARAQPAGAGAAGARPQQPMVVKPVKPGLYMITGKGANAVIRVTSQGVILVDTKNPGEDVQAELMAAIRSVTPLPVKYVFITNHHNDHAGNTAAFLGSAEVIATAAEKDAVARYTPANGSRPPAAPNKTFAGVHSVKLGGVEARAYSFGPAATDDDLMVYFPDLKVLAAGDGVHAATTPNADYPFGGSVLGWRASLKAMMALDFDTVIPGQGSETMTRAEVVQYQHKWDTLISRAQALVKAGTPKDMLIAQIRTDDLGWNINAPFWTQPARLDPFYAEMAR
jgi:cyclase